MLNKQITISDGNLGALLASVCSFTRISSFVEAEEEANGEGQLGQSASDAHHQHRTDGTEGVLSLGSQDLWLLGLEQGSGLQSGKISALGFSHSLCCSALVPSTLIQKLFFPAWHRLQEQIPLGFQSVCVQTLSPNFWVRSNIPSLIPVIHFMVIQNEMPQVSDFQRG